MRAAKLLASLPEDMDFMFMGRMEPYWITPNLGTMSELDGCPADVVIVDVRDLIDGAGNKPKDVWKRIKLGVALVRSGKRVAVRCHAGISRSNSVAAGVLAVLKWPNPELTELGVHLFYMNCLSEVQSKVPRTYPNGEIVATVIDALKLGMWKK